MFLCGCIEIVIFLISGLFFIVVDFLLAVKEFSYKRVRQICKYISYLVANSETIISCYGDTTGALNLEHDPF